MLVTPPAFVPLHEPQAHADPLVFVFRGDELLIRAIDGALPDADARAALGIADEANSRPVGLLGARYCSAAWVDARTEAPAGHVFEKLRRLFGRLDDALVAVAGRAFQIAEWARTHRHCGVCAAPMEAVPGERCMRCPACGHVAYPRISPAMMVLVRKGDAILLARHAGHGSGFFTALAGFLEAGESIEDAIHREVQEEVGLRVQGLRYFASQSWPFPHSLMIAFTAEYAGGEISVDGEEIAEARWFGPGDPLPPISGGYSVAGALIRAHLPAASTRVDESRCPLCGQPNACGAHQAGRCWCADETVPAGLLARVPAGLQRKACICRACIRAYHTEAGVASLARVAAD